MCYCSVGLCYLDDSQIIEELRRRGVWKQDRYLGILRDYIENDLEAAEPEYVKEILYDICGCSNEEIEAIGLDYLIDEEVEYEKQDDDRYIRYSR